MICRVYYPNSSVALNMLCDRTEVLVSSPGSTREGPLPACLPSSCEVMSANWDFISVSGSLLALTSFCQLHFQPAQN